MASSLAIRARFETLRSLAYTGISGSYAAVGSALQNPVRMLKVTNLTDAALLVSFDGSTNHDVIAASSAFIYDITSNAAVQAQFSLSAGDLVYVKTVSDSPIEGSVYVTVVYGSEN